jgi:putative endonuclease
LKRHSLGRYGETIAQQFLVKAGYAICVCNWRHGRHGEIDIIAYHPVQQVLAFIEVKTRRTESFGSCIESLTPKQQAKIRVVAEAYLGLTESIPPYQHLSFDLITILPSSHPDIPPQVQHYPNAF